MIITLHFESYIVLSLYATFSPFPKVLRMLGSAHHRTSHSELSRSTPCRSPGLCTPQLGRFVFSVARRTQLQGVHGECDIGNGSTGAEPYSSNDREFLKSTHAIMKQHNPHLPIMVRQARGTPARAFVRYGTSHLDVPVCVLILQPAPEKGDEKHVELDNLNQADVSSKIAQLLKKPS